MNERLVLGRRDSADEQQLQVQKGGSNLPPKQAIMLQLKDLFRMLPRNCGQQDIKS